MRGANTVHLPPAWVISRLSVDLITLGESLIDLPSTQRGVSLANAPGFAKVPAGAPANVAVAAAHLGLRSAFLSKVGDDAFGEAIIQTFAARGVDTSRVRKDPTAHTGLAFVSIREDGERDFLFYFNPVRDLALRPEELDGTFCAPPAPSTTAASPSLPSRAAAATLTAARIAREGGALISYDPNLRPRLWPDEDAMRRQALDGFAEADIAKVSKEELCFSSRTISGCPRWRPAATCWPRTRTCAWSASQTARTEVRPLQGHEPFDACPRLRREGHRRHRRGDAFTAGLVTFLLRQGRTAKAPFGTSSTFSRTCWPTPMPAAHWPRPNSAREWKPSAKPPSRSFSPLLFPKAVRRGTMFV